MRRHNRGRGQVVRNANGLTRHINYLTLSMWWFTHSLKVGALKVTCGGVTHLTQVVGVVALLTWKVGQLVIYGASGEVTLTHNMVAKVTQVIIRSSGRRENPMLNHLIVVAVDEGRTWIIIALLHDRRENPMLDHLVIVAVDEGRRWHIITLASKDGSIILARHPVARLWSLVLEGLRSRTCYRTILKKSQGRLGIINATKRDGGEVKLRSIVLELVRLGHLGGTSLMLVVELGRREVCLGWRSLAFMSSCSALIAPM